MADSKVIVFGSLNMDLSIECDREPAVGETILGRNFITNAGGKGANQAYAAARMGADVCMVGAAGQDSFGDAIVASLAEAGVNCEHVARTPDAPTGVAVIERIGGDNSIIVDSGANMRPDAAFVGSVLDEEARPGDIFLVQLECDFAETMDALRDAHERGLRTAINPAPARALPETVYPFLDLVVVNETECEELTGIYPGDEPSMRTALDEFLLRGVGCAIVTLGDQGSALLCRGQRDLQRCVPPKVAVEDTTCAGDTYIGAFVAEWARGSSFADAMELATKASALATTRRGAQQSVPTLEEAKAVRLS